MKIPILMYHRIGKPANERRYTVSPSNFERQMQFLSADGYNVVSIELLLDALEGIVALPEKSVVITFDDGFQDTYEYACPVLKRLGFTATFFLVTRLIGKTNEWMQQEGHASAPLMDWTAVKRLLDDGFSVGSHTATHRVLPELAPAIARREIEESKWELEDRLGVAIRSFAYPYGRLSYAAQEMVREAGYSIACSTRTGFNGLGIDRFVLRRLDIQGTDSVGMFRRNLFFGENQMSLIRVTGYYLGRAKRRLSSIAR